MDEVYNKYTYIELLYENMMLEKGYLKEDLYPDKWFSNYNYEQKINILVEAINNETIISNLESYKELFSCIRTKGPQDYRI